LDTVCGAVGLLLLRFVVDILILYRSVAIASGLTIVRAFIAHASRPKSRNIS